MISVPLLTFNKIRIKSSKILNLQLMISSSTLCDKSFPFYIDMYADPIFTDESGIYHKSRKKKRKEIFDKDDLEW